ncbi:MAG: hypothetical protein CL877_08760 [Dehalococcoidales bacterium]|nr:hypothetical protein [Dehalococcoidales bacterium]|tara:strand:+ start:243 stop:992 length:750 start_codon:yes stop_codon:yes gene_type:complete
MNEKTEFYTDPKNIDAFRRNGKAANAYLTVSAPGYYAEVVTCSEACPLVQNVNVDPNLSLRYLPRGTTSRAAPGVVRLMIVATNPGSPQEREDGQYRGKSGEALADAAWQFTAATLEGNTAFSHTLAPLLAEASFLLDCPESEVLDQCVFTNHVRCSTPQSFSAYNKGEDLHQRKQISQICITRHLVREIEYWSPDRVAVFSATARDAMRTAGVDFHGYIAHPTALGKNRNREYRQQKLAELKNVLWPH